MCGGGGGGLGNFSVCRGVSWKKILPQMGGQIFIYESMGGGGLCPQTPSHIINFFIFHAPLFTTTTEKCWDALSQILLWQCTPSLDHAQVQTNAYRHMGNIFNKLLIFCWTEWNAGMEPTLGLSLSTGICNQRPVNLPFNQIMCAKKHHKFQCMYVSEVHRLSIFFPFLDLII